MGQILICTSDISNADAANKVVDEINALGQGKAIAAKGDATNLADGRAIIDETIKAFGKLDILVLNAGIMGSKTISDITEEDFDTHIQANVKGPLFMAKAALDHLPSRESPHSPAKTETNGPFSWRTYHLLLVVPHRRERRPAQCFMLRRVQRRCRAALPCTGKGPWHEGYDCQHRVPWSCQHTSLHQWQATTGHRDDQEPQPQQASGRAG